MNLDTRSSSVIFVFIHSLVLWCFAPRPEDRPEVYLKLDGSLSLPEASDGCYSVGASRPRLMG